ncbi:MAG: hypothetical protein LBG44_09490 [Gemmatimonadota bacterium]|nr:hypothetical protein [Gemmatimonadota bacterium]
MSADPVSSNAWLRLRGHEALPATAELSWRPARGRFTRAVLILIGCWALAPALFFIPPHLPWVVLAVGGGIYLAIRQWRGEYVVGRFSGECPRCRAALAVTSGTRIRLPHLINCFHCHHEPTLEVTAEATSSPARTG